MALSPQDVQIYVAVRGKALAQLEEALAGVEGQGGDALSHVGELSVAEREAARALGVDWRRFTRVREQVGRLFTAQRQRDDQRLLAAELYRAKQDLSGQLEIVRDPAGHQFLLAQIGALTVQLEKLDRERQLPAERAGEMKLLESVRAEIATLQGRQDKVQHRLQELFQRATAFGPAAPSPSSAKR